MVESLCHIAGRGFTLSGQPFYLRGLNHYPRHAPWEKFLTNSDLTEVQRELDLIAQAGFNTLRIALWYDPLFTCAPEDAVPNATGFAKLDALIASAQERGLHLIVTLNDLPDLYFRPLYTDYARYDAQTAFIVQRYRDEPAILAWDVRNEADLDYGADGRPALVTSEVVLKWLAHITEIVRKNDQHHLITAAGGVMQRSPTMSWTFCHSIIGQMRQALPSESSHCARKLPNRLCLRKWATQPGIKLARPSRQGR